VVPAGRAGRMPCSCAARRSGRLSAEQVQTAVCTRVLHSGSETLSVPVSVPFRTRHCTGYRWRSVGGSRQWSRAAKVTGQNINVSPRLHSS
jgi:hypothetical protein